MSRKTPSRRKFDLTLMLRKYFVSAFVLFTFAAYAIHDRLTNTTSVTTPLPTTESNSSGTQLILSSPRTNLTGSANATTNTTAALPTAIPASATPIPPTPVPVLPTALPIVPTANTASSIAISAPTLLPPPTLVPTAIPRLPTATDTPPQITAVRGANVRNGDSTVYDVIGGLQAGQSATVIGISSRDNNWFLIQMPDGSQGWVSSTVVNVSGNLTSVPPVQPPPLPTATDVPAAPPSSGLYANGQFTGDPADAFYGTVQVSVTIQNGQISNVQFLDYPHDRRTSQQINAVAMPYLQSEAIQVQSANVNIISGATLTSEAFALSLQSALSKAKAGV